MHYVGEGGGYGALDSLEFVCRSWAMGEAGGYLCRLTGMPHLEPTSAPSALALVLATP